MSDLLNNTNTWINARIVLREALVSSHEVFMNMYPEISNDLKALSEDFLNTFDEETDAGIRFAIAIDRHIHKVNNVSLPS